MNKFNLDISEIDKSKIFLRFNILPLLKKISYYIFNKSTSSYSNKKNKIKTLVTKAELKAKQDKIEKLETNDLSYYLSKNIFGDDSFQNMFVYQPTFSKLQI